MGVREWLLRNLLSWADPTTDTKWIAWSAILLRLNWIAAEAFFALVTYWYKPAIPDQLSHG
jgi:hypothetical protein